MATATKKEMNFIQKVLALVQMDDEGKLILFYKAIKKEWNKQVKIRKDSLARLKTKYEDTIEGLVEELEELEEERNLAVLSIDVDSIQTREQRVEYVKTYNSKVDNAIMAVERKEEELQSTKEQYDSDVETLNKEIAYFEVKLKAIS